MALTGEEIRARLTSFAARWSVYEGSERSEAQTFLAQLFECYGTSREDVARFEHRQTGGFVDLLWPGVCLFEMKAPSEAKRLASHREQAMRYWREAAEPEQNMPSPNWVVICAFRRLEVWQPGKFPKAPRIVLDLIDLPDQYDALLFLVGRELVEADWAAILLTAPDAPLRPPHVDRGLHVRLPAAGGSPPPGAAAPAASLPEALIGQLANQLPNGGGLALSSARELPTGARVAVLLAPGLFRLDLRHLEDTLKISVRNLSGAPIYSIPTDGPPRTILTTEDVTVQRPLATNARMRLRLGSGASAQEAEIILSALSGIEAGKSRVTAQAVIRPVEGTSEAPPNVSS